MFVVQFDAKHRAGQHGRDLAFDFYVLFIHGWQTGNWDKPKDEKAESGFHRTPLEIPNRLIAATTATTAVFTAATRRRGRVLHAAWPR